MVKSLIERYRKRTRDELQLKERLLVKAASEDADFKAWLEHRWWTEVLQAHRKVGRNRFYFLMIRTLQVSGAAALPVLATAGTLTSGHYWGWWTVGVSLAVALLVAVDQVCRPGLRWRVAYESYHQLIRAAWTYLVPVAPPPDSASKTFLKTVEAIIANREFEYLRDIANLNTSAAEADGTGRRPETSEKELQS